MVFVPNANYVKEFHSGNGMIAQHLRKEAKNIARVAKTFVDSNTGQLASSIDADTAVTFVDGGLAVTVSATADHALPVHEGVQPAIRMGKNGPYFHRGQRANPFLVKAMRVVIH